MPGLGSIRVVRGLVCGLVVLGLVPLTALVRAQEPGGPDLRPGEPVPAVPVHDEPHHRQLFQHGPMRILELQLPGGDTSWFHSHEWPVLYVTLSQGQMRTQNLGEEWGGGRAGGARGAAAGQGGRGAAAGQAPTGRGAGAGPASPRPTSTTSYAGRPVTHRIQNTGTGLVRAMVVVNETQGDETTPEDAAGFTATPELTNRWFRAYRIALGPGEKTGSHRHRAPVAIIQATAGAGLGAGAMTFEFNEPGQWAYFDAEDSHEVRNTGEGRVEFIEVEVRRK
jgi:quercetin dioxygenase-like cupin family protein